MKNYRNILVIEDMALLRELLCDLLEARGFQVRACEDGVSALNAAREHYFHVIIIDFRLPNRLDGADVTKHMRLHFPASIIIGVSAEDKRKDFLAAGADKFLLKPYRYWDILSFIRAKSECRVSRKVSDSGVEFEK